MIVPVLLSVLALAAFVSVVFLGLALALWLAYVRWESK